MTLDKEESVECPLCMETLEIDDLTFFPCVCGYQVCRFCWHRLRTDGNGLCPACRQTYTENPADFTPLSATDIQRLKAEKRQRRAKTTTTTAAGGTGAQGATSSGDSRKHLVDVRVVQRNLVFVVGLPPRLADGDVLRRNEYFGQFGKIRKILVSHPSQQAASQGQCASAHVTYCRPDDALRAIRSVNNAVVDNKTLKVSLGTTKYCSLYLRHQQCSKPDCTFLHEPGDELASFTKEEMQQGRHQEYERRLLEHWVQQQQRKLNSNKDKLTADPAVTSASLASSSSSSGSSMTSRITQLDCHVPSAAAVVSGAASAVSRGSTAVGGTVGTASATSGVGKKSRGRRGRRRGHTRTVSPHGEDECSGEADGGDDEVRAATPDMCSGESGAGSGGGGSGGCGGSESDRSSPLSLTEQTVAASSVPESTVAASSSVVPQGPPTPPPEHHQHQQQFVTAPTLVGDTFSTAQLVLDQPTPPPDVFDAEMTTTTNTTSTSSDSTQTSNTISRQRHDTDMATADDDLDFDPFEETAKGLSVLIERERQSMVRGVGVGPGVNPALQHLSGSAMAGGGRVRLPPPGFGAAAPLSVDPSIVALGISRRASVVDDACCFPVSVPPPSASTAIVGDHYMSPTPSDRRCTLPPPLQHVHRLHHHHPHNHHQQETWSQGELRGFHADVTSTSSSCLFQQQQQHQRHTQPPPSASGWPSPPPHWLHALEQLTETPPPQTSQTAASVPPPGLWSSSVPPPHPPTLAQQQQQQQTVARLSEYM